MAKEADFVETDNATVLPKANYRFDPPNRGEKTVPKTRERERRKRITGAAGASKPRL